MQLVQPSKFFSVTIFRTRSIGSIGVRTCELAIFSNAKFFSMFVHCKKWTVVLSYLSCVTSLIIPYRGGREVTSVAQLSLIIPYG